MIAPSNHHPEGLDTAASGLLDQRRKYGRGVP